jgi:hypothetical protein
MQSAIQDGFDLLVTIWCTLNLDPKIFACHIELYLYVKHLLTLLFIKYTTSMNVTGNLELSMLGIV